MLQHDKYIYIFNSHTMCDLFVWLVGWFVCFVFLFHYSRNAIIQTIHCSKGNKSENLIEKIINICNAKLHINLKP